MGEYLPGLMLHANAPALNVQHSSPVAREGNRCTRRGAMGFTLGILAHGKETARYGEPVRVSKISALRGRATDIAGSAPAQGGVDTLQEGMGPRPPSRTGRRLRKRSSMAMYPSSSVRVPLETFNRQMV